MFCLLFIACSELLFHVPRGEKQECKFFEQLVQIFGDKYMTSSDSLADDTADGVGKKSPYITVVHHGSVMKWLYQLDNSSGKDDRCTLLYVIYSLKKRTFSIL